MDMAGAARVIKFDKKETNPGMGGDEINGRWHGWQRTSDIGASEIKDSSQKHLDDCADDHG